MNDDRLRERRQTMLIILAVLLAAILCWAPIGVRMFLQPSAAVSTSNEPRP